MAIFHSYVELPDGKCYVLILMSYFGFIFGDKSIGFMFLVIMHFCHWLLLESKKEMPLDDFRTECFESKYVLSLLWDLFAGGLRILHEHTWLTRPIYTTSSRTTNKNHGFWGAEISIISITQQFPSTFFFPSPTTGWGWRVPWHFYDSGNADQGIQEPCHWLPLLIH